jgi:putative phage-type endonuclease
MNIQQNTLEWFAFRQTHIGSSDISCIMGSNPWKDASTLWKERTGKKEQQPMNAAMLHGKETEEQARNQYMADTGILVMPNVLTATKWSVATASLDGISQDGKVICEIKCPVSSKLYENALDNKVPDYYKDQIQWQLMVSGAERCDFFVYLDDENYKLIPFFPDIKRQEMMLIEAKIFWDCVLSDVQPTESGITYIDDKFANEMAQELKMWKQTEKEAKEKIDYLEQHLKELYKDDKKYLFSSAGVRMTWTERKGVIDWKAYCAKCNISEDELEEYRKKSSKYSTFSLIE